MDKFTAWEYLLLDASGHKGNDKENFEPRLKWAQDNLDTLEDFTETADSPYRYAAAVLAVRDAQRGIPSGYMIGWDACASGMQIMSVVTGCLDGCTNTGLIDPTQRKDVYGHTTKVMSGHLNTTYTCERKVVKSAQMPCFYGSKRKPKEVFGDQTPEFHAFHKANYEVAPGACQLMDVMQGSWQDYATSHKHYLPDGYCAFMPVLQKEDEDITVDELGVKFTFRHTVNRGKRKGISLAADCTHSIDGFIVREMERMSKLPLIKNTIAHLIEQELWFRSTEPLVPHEIETHWKKSGVFSWVALDLINEDTIRLFTIDYLTEVHQQLLNWDSSRPSFDMDFIHKLSLWM